MIGKIKLTPEQADAIQKWLCERNGDKAALLDVHATAMKKQGGWRNGNPYRAFNGLDQADMARALLIGYEVEETFEVGDWVACEYEDGAWIAQIERIEGKKVFAQWENGQLDWNYVHHIRHATSEEIKAEKEYRAWKSIGREVGGFREGDIGIFKNEYVDHVDALGVFYKDGVLTGFYPTESFIEFGGADE
ncbi:hypothetical protein CSV63_02835 [Sporosarcina sp. P34]|uniref:hypothetical protein n=1 Tax=Sporosarcina sp. P34 TaxID=2048247 RepID=UPI000C16DCDF|nr:hypothetical protein [Sporosarcina sp. P34]PID16840.1 hypothetical protein CSV63_02835 [Sporosarcina sp. P34]